MKAELKRQLRSMLVVSLLVSATAMAGDRERIANEGAIGDKWMLADGVKLATAEYPGNMAPRGDNVCVALSYRINKDGSTSDFNVIKLWNSESGEKEPVDGFSQAFATVSANAVSQWKFKPRPEVADPIPTRTVATLGFNGQQGVDAAEVRSHCLIKDLAAYLKGRPQRNDVLNQQLERDRQSQEAGLIQEQLRRANAKPGG